MSATQNAGTLLGVIMSHAPDGKAQGLMAKKYYEITMQVFTDFETNQYLELEKVMAGVLNDGLKYGNWPWTEPAKPGHDSVCEPSCAADHSVTVRPK